MKNRQGFTLIELLVTMTIIVILTTLSLAALVGVRKISRDGKRKADLEQIRTALEIYRTDCSTYPPTQSGSAVDVALLTGTGVGNCSADPYMSAVPTDPASPTYQYVYSRTDANHYALCAYLEIGGPAATGCGGTDCGLACNYKVINP